MATHNTAPIVLTFDASPEWMRLDLAAQLAGVSKRSLRRWARLGLVRVSRPAGGRVLVSRESLRQLIERSASGEAA